MEEFLALVRSLLTSAFFLQGSYLLTYVPLAIIVMSFILMRRHQWKLFESFFYALLIVAGSYVVLVVGSSALGFAVTKLGYLLVNMGMKKPRYYAAVVVVSCGIYALVQGLMIKASHSGKRIARPYRFALTYNGVVALIMIGLYAFLFVRHL